MLLYSVRLGGMTLNRKIRIYRTVSKEVKQKALLRYQTQSTNRLWLGAQVQLAFFWNIEIQIVGRMWNLWMMCRSMKERWQILNYWMSWGLIQLQCDHLCRCFLSCLNLNCKLYSIVRKTTMERFRRCNRWSSEAFHIIP